MDSPLCNLCISPNTVKVIKSRGVKWAGHVACTIYEECIQNLKGKDYFKDLAVDGNIISECILE
jgi:hypothetical protein